MRYRPPNFRDVGETLEILMETSPFGAGRLFRGGKFDSLTSAADLDNPATIVSLRRGADPAHLDGTRYLHIPAANETENYDTSRRHVRTWIESVLTGMTADDVAWPCYVHCTSGRDRTGVVVAAMLLLLRVPRDVIVEEYLLSDGAERSLIEQALDGLRARPLDFDPARLRRVLVSE